MTTDTGFDLDNMEEIVDEFLVETDELIESLDTNLVELEHQPENINLLNEIFRAAHTIKGTSSFLGLEQITTLTHKMEDILNKLRKSEMTVTPTVMDVLLESLDLLKLLFNNLKEKKNESVDLTPILEKLQLTINGDSIPVASSVEDKNNAPTKDKSAVEQINSDDFVIDEEEDVQFELDDMQEIIDDFLVEADDLIGSLDTNLVELESRPDDLNLLNEIFRAAHTVKGTSSFLGLDQITSLTHKMEDILNKLRKSEMKATPEIMDLMLASLDILKELLQRVKDKNKEKYDLSEILTKLAAVLNEDYTPVITQDAADSHAEDSDDSDHQENDNGKTDRQKAKASMKKSADQTIRVDVERLDTLMNMMGELVLGRNSMVQTVNHLLTEHENESKYEKLAQSTNSINFITTELQMAVMKMRMQPVGKVFKKFPRLVRDLSRDSKKDIALEITGETTELDKSVIEEIGDPLVHIIRNSCDHGIESPVDRIASGKPRQGTIKLSAMQEGSNIVIKIEDDGKGLDIDAIRNKAVERNLVSKEDIANMPKHDVFKFIFEAGFSTAKKITDVSGRGVGMDVVRTNIEKLNGFIELDSELGKGTTISIKLPLTLAIIQGLLVESDDEVFILPLSSVHETVKTQQAEIYYANKKPVLSLRNEVIPIVNLNHLLKANTATFTLAQKPYIVIVGLAEKKIGIMIDKFMGQEEVVIKSLGQYLGTTEGVAGATILGDGRIRLIVDLIGLFNIAKRIC